jgi:cytochrome c biogenesis protein CcmG/thiol:disulfide interchange protein DsbE
MIFSRSRHTLWALAALLAIVAPTVHAGDVCNVARKKANLNFTVKDIAGKDVRLSQYKGQVVMLNFWATWCVPCRIEIPSLNALYRDYKERGFVVLGVSVDSEVPAIKPFARVMKMNYPVLIGAGREDLSDAFGPFVGFPTSVLVARDGTMCVRHVGLVSKAQIEKQIGALL